MTSCTTESWHLRKTLPSNGVLGGTCTPGQPNGTHTEYEEGVDIDQSKLTGDSRLYTNPIDGGGKPQPDTGVQNATSAPTLQILEIYMDLRIQVWQLAELASVGP
jgi:hypothetical protein